MPLKHWKKISEETIHDGPWIVYKHDRFTYDGGREGNYFYLDSPGCAMIVPVLADGRVLLVNQYRYLGDRESLEFACGSVRHRNSDGSVVIDVPEVAAARELAEECALVGDLTHVGVYNPNNGFMKEWAQVFVARNTHPVAAAADDTEEFERVALTPAEIEAKIASGEIWDGMTIAGWMIAKPHLTDIL